MKFFRSECNGVVAVVSAEHAKIFGARKRPEHYGHMVVECEAMQRGARIFTFYDPTRYLQGTEYRAPKYHIGTHQDLEQLIAAGGHELVENPKTEWSGYVPFSYGGSERETRDRDWFYAVNLTDVLKAFGVKFAKAS
ncbi:MAG: hypothetical protein WC641_07680 [Patescibacteria group bacterium]